MIVEQEGRSAVTPTQEIREQRQHILDGRCRWGLGPPRNYDNVDRACLIERQVGDTYVELSKEALSYVVKSIEALDSSYGKMTVSPFWFVVFWNDDPERTEVEVLEVLERAEKYAAMDEAAA